MLPNFLLGTILFLFSTLILANDLPEEGLQAEKNGDLQKAISIYTDFLLTDRGNTLAWLKIAHLEYQLKNYSLTISAYQHAIENDPTNPSIYGQLAQLYAELNQPANALQTIKKAVALQPGNPEYLLHQAQYANWCKDPITALASYQQLVILKKKQNADFSDLLSQIAQLQNQLHHYEEATSTLQELAKLKPSAKVFLALSKNYSAAKKPDQALKAIDQALILEPNNIELLQTKAMLANWLNNQELALATYQKLSKILGTGQKNQVIVETIKKSLKALPSPATKQVALSSFDQLIAEANNQAFAHHYNKAEAAMRKAIKLKPQDPTLYRKLSIIYASANQAPQALTAINQALALSPQNIEYLRARAHFAAWVDDKAQMADSYLRILKLHPNDQDALLNIAFTYAWQGQTDKAIAAYKYYLSHYPDDPRGWVQYSEPLSWVESYKPSLRALEKYRQLHGDYQKYEQIKARVLALAGYYQSANTLNKPLLAKKPEDPFLLSTQTTIYSKNLQVKKEIATLHHLHQLHPDYFELKGLDDVLLTPLRTNINLGSNYTWASDTNRVEQIPTVTGQYFLTPATSLLVQGFYERATAAPDSAFTTINGKTSIFDENLMLGFGTQIPSIANFRAVLGDLKIQGKNNHVIYDALLNGNLTQKLQAVVEGSYNLYRPYLVPQSPRLISLQIMENRIGGALQWQPIIQNYLNLLVSHSDLSDTNAYWHINAWPKMRIFGSEKLQLRAGLNNDFWDYKKRLQNGYYSPLHFQSYEGTLEAYYALSHNLGCSLSGGFGMQKDETFPHLYYEEDLAGQLFIGIFTDWELRINGGYTLRLNPQGSYRSWGSGIILTRRF